MDRGNLCLPERNDLLKLIMYELFYEAIYNIFYDIISKKSWNTQKYFIIFILQC